MRPSCRLRSALWRDDLLERSIARAKAIRSVSLLRRKVQWTFRASSAVSAYSANVSHFMEHLPGGGRWFSARGIVALLRSDCVEEEVRAIAVRCVAYKIFRSVRRNARKHRLVISNA